MDDWPRLYEKLLHTPATVSIQKATDGGRRVFRYPLALSRMVHSEIDKVGYWNYKSICGVNSSPGRIACAE
jgi:hypothetical protein